MNKDAELPAPNAQIGREVNRTPQARYGRFALWVASASSMAIGVAGTVAYGMWFDHDQRAYVAAIASARQALGPGGRESPMKTTVWAGQVSPTAAPPASETASADIGFVQPASSVRPDPRGAFSQGSGTSQVAAGRSGQVQCSTAHNRTNSISHSKQSRGPFVRIASFFHHASYRRHVTGSERDNFSHP
jgi:hypothetical protein